MENKLLKMLLKDYFEIYSIADSREDQHTPSPPLLPTPVAAIFSLQYNFQVLPPRVSQRR